MDMPPRVRAPRFLVRVFLMLLTCAASASAQTMTWVANEPPPVTTVASGQTLEITGAGNHDFNDLALTNDGIVNWTAGVLRSGNGGTFTNNATFNDPASGTLNNAFGGTGGTTFINASTGTYFKTESGTVTAFDVPFTNNGRIDVASGATVRLNAGGTFNAGSSMTGTGTLELADGTLTASDTMSFDNLLFKGGMINGTHTLNGAITWTAGTFNNSGSTTIGSTGTLYISGANDHDFNDHTLINDGVVEWTGGQIRSGNGGTFTNNATFNDSASSAFNNDYGGTGGTTFINDGTYVKTGNGSVTTFSATFVNNDLVDIDAGATLRLTAASTFNDGSSTTGTGALELTAGTLTANGTVAFSNFLFKGGTITGTHTLNGAIAWTGGTFNNANTTTIGETGVLTISGTNDHDFNDHTFINEGVVDWTGGQIRSGNGGTFTNNAEFNDSASSAFNNDYGGTGGTTFVNNGTYAKSGAGSTTTFSAHFVNNDTIDVAATSLLRLTGGATFTAGSSTTGDGTVELANGTLTATGTVTFSKFLFSGGVIAGTPVLNGAIEWTGGNLNHAGTTTVGTAGTLKISGTNAHDFNDHTFVNDGTVEWTGGEIRSGNGGTFTNNNLFKDSSSSSINNDYGGTGGTTFINASGATYQKDGTGTTTVSASLVNRGTIQVNDGVLKLTGSTSLENLSEMEGDGTLEIGGGTLNPTGAVTLENLLFSAGALIGTHDLMGLIRWTGGDWSSSGTTTIAQGGQLKLEGSSGTNHDFDGRDIVIEGRADWLAGHLRSGHGGSFLIASDGLFFDQAAALLATQTINNAFAGTGGTTFINQGSYVKASAGITRIDVPFTNHSTSDGIFVDAGTLRFASTFTQTAGSIIVAEGATVQFDNPLTFAGGELGGSGTIAAPVTNSGTIEPGADNSETEIGELAFTSSLELTSTSLVTFELGGPASYDQLVAQSAVLNGTLQVSFTQGFENTIKTTDSFTLLSTSNANGLSGTFAGLANGARFVTADHLASFQINYLANAVVISSFQPVPEPSTCVLLALGLVGICWLRRRKSRSPARA